MTYSPTIHTLDGTLTLWPDAMVLMHRKAGPAGLAPSPVHLRLGELESVDVRPAGLLRRGVLRLRPRTDAGAGVHAGPDRCSTVFSRGAMQREVVALCRELSRLGVVVTGLPPSGG